MPEYTLIGYLEDSRLKWCETIEAESAEAAIQSELEEGAYPDLRICGVLEGRHECVDKSDRVDGD